MPPPPEFSALLLAGGRSSRMGRDKALLPHPVSGLPLLAHQAALLRALPGCAELLLAAPADRAYDAPGARRVEDPLPDAGPLAGLAAGLAAATRPHLLVLAVDLPFVTGALLTRLLAGLPSGGGSVPRHPSGAFEPLCGVYPVLCYDRVAAALTRRELSLQRLLQAAVADGWMRVHPLSPDDLPAFTNWNTPEDAGLG